MPSDQQNRQSAEPAPAPAEQQNPAVAEADRIREATKADHDRAARESARRP
jgi:hypothetical protein